MCAFLLAARLRRLCCADGGGIARGYGGCHRGRADADGRTQRGKHRHAAANAGRTIDDRLVPRVDDERLAAGSAVGVWTDRTPVVVSDFRLYALAK